MMHQAESEGNLTRVAVALGGYGHARQSLADDRHVERCPAPLPPSLGNHTMSNVARFIFLTFALTAFTASVQAAAPSVPRDVRLFPQITSDGVFLRVYWKRPSSNGGSAITHYRVEWAWPGGNDTTVSAFHDVLTTDNAQKVGDLAAGGTPAMNGRGLASHEGKLYIVNGDPKALFILNLSTQRAERVDSNVTDFGVSPAPSIVEGLASHNGQLYMFAKVSDNRALYTVAPDTGVATPVTWNGGTGNPEGLTSHAGALYLLDRTHGVFAFRFTDPHTVAGVDKIIGARDFPRSLASHNGLLHVGTNISGNSVQILNPERVFTTEAEYYLEVGTAVSLNLDRTPDHQNPRLYGLTSHDGNLYLLDHNNDVVYELPSLSHRIGGLDIGVTYTVEVTAHNEDGSARASAEEELLALRPPAPQITPVPTDDYIDLTWQLPDDGDARVPDDGGARVSAYTIEVTDSDGTLVHETDVTPGSWERVTNAGVLHFGVDETEPSGLTSYNGKLYMVGTDTTALYTLDTDTGAATPVGDASAIYNGARVAPQALAVDDDGTFYMASGNSLYTLDIEAGTAAYVQGTGERDAKGLAFHDGVLYVVGDDNDALFRLNFDERRTNDRICDRHLCGGNFGVSMLSFPTGLTSHLGRLYMTAAWNVFDVYTVDTATGAATYAFRYPDSDEAREETGRTDYDSGVRNTRGLASHNGALYVVENDNKRENTQGALWRIQATPYAGSHRIEGLTPGDEYTITVSATNEQGAGKSGRAVAVAGAPGALSEMTLTPGDEYIDVAWQAPESDGGAPVNTYKVTWQAAGGDETSETLQVGAAQRVNEDGSVIQFGVNEGSPRGLAALNGELYMVGQGKKRLYRFLTDDDGNLTGAAQQVGGNFDGFENNPTGLAALGGELYMMGNDFDALYRFNNNAQGPAGGRPTRLGSVTGVSPQEDGPVGLAVLDRTLYMVGTGQDRLYRFLPGNDGRPGRAAERVGEVSRFGLGVNTPEGLGELGGALYMVTSGNRALYRFRTDAQGDLTGVARRIGNATNFGVGETRPFGLASLDGVLYMVGQSTDALYRLQADRYRITGLTNDVEYTVSVAAVNDRGTGISSAAAATSIGPPGEVQNPQVRVSGDRELEVSWEAPDNDGGAHITGYQLTWTSAVTSASDDVMLPAPATSHVFTVPEAKVEYTITITAVNSEGLGTPTELTATAVTLPGMPEITLSSGNQFIDVAYELADDGGAPVNTYRITYEADGQSTEEIEAQPGSAQRVGNVENFSISGDGESPTGLASHNGALYMVESDDDSLGHTVAALYRFVADAQGNFTGTAVRVGDADQFGESERDPKGLASHNDDLYMVGGTNDALYTLSTVNGTATPVNQSATQFGVGVGAPGSLASHDGVLYMTAFSRGKLFLYRFLTDERNKPTGSATLVETVAQFGVGETVAGGLASHNGRLYMAGSFTGALYTLDLAAGRAERVNQDVVAFGAGVDNSSGLTSHDGVLYMTGERTNSAPAALYRLQINTWRIEGLTNGVEYTVSAAAVNEVGEGPPSDSLTATPAGPPGVPRNVRLTLGDQFINVTYEAPEDDGGAAISAYKVTWQTAGEQEMSETLPVGAAQRVGNVENFGLQGTDVEGFPRGLAALDGTLYMVGAGNKALYRFLTDAQGNLTGAVQRIGTPFTGVEDVPTGLAALDGTLYMAGYTGKALYRFLPDDDGNPTADLQRVDNGVTQFGVSPGEEIPVGLAALDGTLYMIGSGQDLLYRLLPDDGITPPNGIAAPVGTVTEFDATEGRPEGLGELGGTLYMVTSGTSKALYRFLTDAQGGLTGAARRVGNVMEFGVEEMVPFGLASLGGVLYMVGQSTDALYRLQTPDGGGYHITGLTNGVEYTVTVAAVNERGIGASAVAEATPTNPPDAPQSIQLTPGNRFIDVAWEAATPADGEAPTITYRITYTYEVAGQSTMRVINVQNDIARVGGAQRFGNVESFGVGEGVPTGLAALGDRLYMVGTDTAALYRFHTDLQNNPTGAAMRVGNVYRFGVGERSPSGLASHNGVLYMVGGNANLYRFHTDLQNNPTGAAMQVENASNFGIGERLPTGLASHNRVLYMIGGEADALYTLNAEEGTAARVDENVTRFGVGEHSPKGLASHNSRLYMAGGGTNALYTLNPATGRAERVNQNVTLSGAGVAIPSGLASYNGFLYITGERTSSKAAALYRLRTDTWRIKGLTNGTAYTVSVAAVNTAGSGPSLTDTAIPEAIPPDRPRNPQADVAGDGRLEVSWEAPFDDGGETITGYELRWYRADGSGPMWSAVTPGALPTSYTIPDSPGDKLEGGVEYEITIAAVNSKGRGAPTTFVATAVAVPEAPQIALTPGDRFIVVTWTLGDDGGAPVDTYRVTHQAEGLSEDNIYLRTPPVTNHHQIENLDNGTRYTVWVSVSNDAGYSPRSNLRTAIPATAPSMPQEMHASVVGHRAYKVSWEAPAENGGLDIMRYHLRWHSATAADDRRATLGGTERSRIIRNLVSGADYTITLAADNGREVGASTQLDVTVRTPPDRVRDLQLMPGEGSITAIWRGPSDDGGAPVNGYTVVATPKTSPLDTTTIDAPVGSAQRISPVSRFNVREDFPGGLASLGGNLYMVGASRDTLYTLDVHTGIASAAGNFGINLFATGLAALGDTLYMVDIQTGALYTLNVDTGHPSQVGTAVDFNVNENIPRGLAALDGTLYMVGWSRDAFHTLDVETGAADQTLRIGDNGGFNVGETSPSGLAELGGTLYMVGYTRQALYTLNSATGVARRVNPSVSQFSVGENTPDGLASHDGILYMVGQTHDALYRMQTRHSGSYRMDNLDDGTEYTVTVRAVNDVDASAITRGRTTPGTPAAPTVTTVTSGDGYIDVAWRAGDDRGGPITAYEITWRPAGAQRDMSERVSANTAQRIPAAGSGLIKFGVGESTPTGLASLDGTLYMVGQENDALYTLDVDTGRAAPVSSDPALTQFGVGEDRPSGLASLGDTLYMVGDDADALYALSPTAGTATRVGSTNFGSEGHPSGLASLGTTLYMVDEQRDALYTLTLDGSASQRGAVNQFGAGVRIPTGLAALDNTLYMVGWDATGSLYTLNTGTGSATRVDGIADAFGVGESEPGGLTAHNGILYMVGQTEAALYRLQTPDVGGLRITDRLLGGTEYIVSVSAINEHGTGEASALAAAVTLGESVTRLRIRTLFLKRASQSQ